MEIDYCKIYKCACTDVEEITENQYVCGMQCLGCEDKETRIRGQNHMLRYEVDGKTYEIPTIMSSGKKYTLGADELENLRKL